MPEPEQSSSAIFSDPFDKSDEERAEQRSPLSLEPNSSAIENIMSTKDWVSAYAEYLRGSPKPVYDKETKTYITSKMRIRNPVMNELGVNFVVSKIGIVADPNVKTGNLTIERIYTICKSQSRALRRGLFENQYRFGISDEDFGLVPSIIVDSLIFSEVSLKHSEGGAEAKLLFTSLKQSRVEVFNQEPPKSRGWLDRAKSFVSGGGG